MRDKSERDWSAKQNSVPISDVEQSLVANLLLDNSPICLSDNVAKNNE